MLSSTMYFNSGVKVEKTHKYSIPHFWIFWPYPAVGKVLKYLYNNHCDWRNKEEPTGESKYAATIIREIVSWLYFLLMGKKLKGINTCKILTRLHIKMVVHIHVHVMNFIYVVKKKNVDKNLKQMFQTIFLEKLFRYSPKIFLEKQTEVRELSKLVATILWEKSILDTVFLRKIFLFVQNHCQI